jgi:hypothetical protein
MSTMNTNAGFGAQLMHLGVGIVETKKEESARQAAFEARYQKWLVTRPGGTRDEYILQRLNLEWAFCLVWGRNRSGAGNLQKR